MACSACTACISSLRHRNSARGKIPHGVHRVHRVETSTSHSSKNSESTKIAVLRLEGMDKSIGDLLRQEEYLRLLRRSLRQEIYLATAKEESRRKQGAKEREEIDDRVLKSLSISAANTPEIAVGVLAIAATCEPVTSIRTTRLALRRLVRSGLVKSLGATKVTRYWLV